LNVAVGDQAARAVEQMLTLVIAALEDAPIESGWDHPAEGPLRDFLIEHGAATICGTIFHGQHRAALADFIRLLGRMELVDADVRSSIVRQGLRAASVEIRDAAVQAAELWGDPASLECLRDHEETTPWLADYLGRVLREHSKSNPDEFSQMDASGGNDEAPLGSSIPNQPNRNKPKWG